MRRYIDKKVALFLVVILEAPFALDDRRVIECALAFYRKQRVLCSTADLGLFGIDRDFDGRPHLSLEIDRDRIRVAVIYDPWFVECGGEKLVFL